MHEHDKMRLIKKYHHLLFTSNKQNLDIFARLLPLDYKLNTNSNNNTDKNNNYNQQYNFEEQYSSEIDNDIEYEDDADMNVPNPFS